MVRIQKSFENKICQMEKYEEIISGEGKGGRHWRSAGKYIFNGFLEKSVTF